MNKSRTLSALLAETLDTFRVVSVTGARQSGKTTLVRGLCSTRGMAYVSLEDAVARAAAAADSDGWLAGFSGPVAIDEIQHVPGLFRAIKQRVDGNRDAGQYLITGSAMWLSMKAVGETLAGRAGLLELWPFSIAEREARTPFDFGLLTGSNLDAERFAESATEPIDAAWMDRVVLPGGYPEPSGFTSHRQRKLWFESYLSTYLQRDVLDLVRIEHADLYVRMLRLMLGRTGQLLNLNAVAGDIGLPQPTARRYAQWLVTTYQRFDIQPYSTNLGKRLVKTPKSYWSDPGMVAALMGWRSWRDVESAGAAGTLLETWVACELKKWSAYTSQTPIHFWRSHGGGEVDFILEAAGKVTAIEIKAGHSVDIRDLRGMHECRDALGKRFRRGIVLYGGANVVPMRKDIIAVPLSLLGGR